MKRIVALLATVLFASCVHGESPTEPVCPTTKVYTIYVTPQPVTWAGAPYSVDSTSVSCADWWTVRR